MLSTHKEQENAIRFHNCLYWTYAKFLESSFSFLGGKLAAEPEGKSSQADRSQIVKCNVATILRHSTVIPFRWHKQFFMCFYCHLPIQTFDALTVHMNVKHKNPNINPVVELMKKDEKVKIDITSIACKICEHVPKDFDSLINHLKSHNKLQSVHEYGVIPFMLAEGYKCAICSERFQYFIKLNQHMNKHYGNYVCEVCGKLFLSGDRLRSHSLLHTAKFACSLCSETFDTTVKRANHATKVHNKTKSFKCYYCSVSFPTNVGRTDHLKTEHGINMPVFDCPVCKRNFRNASRLQFHLKNVHTRSTDSQACK